MLWEFLAFGGKMATEIERRFLVKDGFDPAAIATRSIHIVQSYLPETGSWVIRVRSEVSGWKTLYHMTMKRALSDMANEEHDLLISPEEYEDILPSCYSRIEKTRYLIEHDERMWEVDLYADPAVDPRIIAEVELSSEDAMVSLPEWIGREVTGDRYFSNYQIAERLSKNNLSSTK